jgi:hypothetical protein
MTPSAQDLRIISRWLTRLRDVCAVNPDDPFTAEKLNDYAELLGRDLPTAAFCTDSLHAAASGSEWFPAYDRIRREVSVWWQANKPACVKHLDSPQGWSLTEQSFERHWIKRTSEIAALPNRIQAHAEYENLASFMRARCPERVWKHLSGEEPLTFQPPTEAENYTAAEAFQTALKAASGVETTHSQPSASPAERGQEGRNEPSPSPPMLPIKTALLREYAAMIDQPGQTGELAKQRVKILRNELRIPSQTSTEEWLQQAVHA